ncbi:protein of unknown function [Methanoculleus bourgensis]|uniref:Uncharacterized protein n=1 Tax=Methanoculleus bourgensis TaxID=83986 RepID=A0A0X3BLU7_9EURY|nr:protein of unknown function [Methanoculleus bourgensis]
MGCRDPNPARRRLSGGRTRDPGLRQPQHPYPGGALRSFSPEEAAALRKRLEIHPTPKHGSWLNIAEIELSAFTRQCLNRRIGDLETLRVETKHWETERNARQKEVDWQFTTAEARVKLKRLYPQIKMK